MNEDIDLFLKELEGVEIIWREAEHGHAMYETVYKGEHLMLRLNDFPDEILLGLFVRGKAIDIEESPKVWHLNSKG